VQALRQESDRAARDLERGREIAPLTLMRMAEPVLVQLMRDAGGTIILDSRQVLLRADAIDITDLAITRIDEVIGDGSGQEGAAPKAVTPDTATPETAEPTPDAPDADAQDAADPAPAAE
jgi:hypothetical protein